MIDALDIEQNTIVNLNTARRLPIVIELPKEANNIDEMFTYADAFGKVRLVYIKSDKNALAVGGEFGFESARYNGFSTSISSYVSQNITSLNPSKDDLNEELFGENVSSFSYISQATLHYSTPKYELKLGRFTIETPYANSDDIRMTPNTFEGVSADVAYSSSLYSQIFYLNRWAGYDSQDRDAKEFQENFKELVSKESFGMIGASLVYEYTQNSELSFHYNYIDSMSSIFYMEMIGEYSIKKESLSLDYGFQAGHIEALENSHIGGDILGASVMFHYDGFFSSLAYNGAYSKSQESISDGFGGGPYFTSLDEATIASLSQMSAEFAKSSDNNVDALRVGVGYEASELFGKSTSVELVYGEFSTSQGKIKEENFIFTYEWSERATIYAFFTNYESSLDNSFKRMLLRADYSF